MDVDVDTSWRRKPSAAPLRVGDVVDSYAGGLIKSYAGTATVEAIGTDWVVVRDSMGEVALAVCDPEELVYYRADN